MTMIGVGIALAVFNWRVIVRVATRLDGRIDRINDRIDRLDDRIDRLDGRIDRLQLAFNNLQQEVHGLAREFSEFRGEVRGSAVDPTH